MTYQEIFEKAKENILSYSVDERKGHLAVQVNIVGEGEGAFYIELKDNDIFVEPYEYYDRDCILKISGENFLAICDGSLDPVAAFTKGRLKIEGSIDKALEFSKIVNDAIKNKKKSEKAEKAVKGKKK